LLKNISPRQRKKQQKDVLCRLRGLDGCLIWSQSTGGLPAGASVLHFETEQLNAGVYSQHKVVLNEKNK